MSETIRSSARRLDRSATRTQVPSTPPGITSPVASTGPFLHPVEVADLEVDDLVVAVVGSVERALTGELGDQRLRAALHGAVGAVAHDLVVVHLERRRASGSRSCNDSS